MVTEKTLLVTRKALLITRKTLPATGKALRTVAVAAGLVAAACGSTDFSDADSATGAPVTDVDAPGRLLVTTPDGAVVVTDPDGGRVLPLAGPATTVLQARAPTWSPDGERVAWGEVAAGPSLSMAVVTAAADGSERTEAAVGVVPFYLYWDPTASSVAYLGSTADSLEMGVVDGGASESLGIPLDTGQPYYFAWAPDGDELLVHVGTDRLERLRTDGVADVVDPTPGRFQAPFWSADGQTLVYALAGEAGQRLVAVSRADGQRDLLAYDGLATFVLSPDGRRIAFQARDDSPGDQGGTFVGVESEGSVPEAQAGALSVIDVASGDIDTVRLTPAIAFFWSPDGSKLLSLVPDGTNQGLVSWEIWDATGSWTTEPFRPSAEFAESYLPFFDQFAQSSTLWSPDSSAFVYAGADAGDEEGIWVQEVRRGAPPVRVADGVMATWSPR